MFDAVSLALLNDLRIQELSQRRSIRESALDEGDPSPATRPAFARTGALPRLVAQAVTLLFAVRIQIVIVR